MPIFFFGLSIYGLILHGWKMFLAGFPFALVMLPFGIYMHSEKKRLSKAKIEVYPETESFVFHHFRFTSQFLPEAPREKENLKFSDILGCKFYSTQSGNLPDVEENRISRRGAEAQSTEKANVTEPDQT